MIGPAFLTIAAIALVIAGTALGLVLGGWRHRTRLRDAQARIDAVFGAAADGIITIDEAGIIAAFNPAAERIFGYSAAEVIGRNVSMLMPEPFRSAHDGYLRHYLATGEARIIGIGREVQGLRKDGSVFPMDLAVGEARMAGRRVFAGIIRDITERKRTADDLRAAKEEAERANAAKTKFLAAASHDLRQPVQALYFFASALANKLRGHRAHSLVRDMQASLDGLNMLLESLLDVSRLDAGLVVPRMTDFGIGAVLDRLAADFAPLAADKGLTLRTVPSSAVVRSDPALLSRIVQNLMANAIRYTSRGSVLVGCRRHGRSLSVEVWDTGIGIPAERTREIFEEFTQLANPERDRHRGLGLGLAIVERLARLLNHQILVRSTPGKGSLFAVVIPLANPALRRPRRRRRPPEASARMIAEHGLVLLIDDEPVVLKGLALMLQAWGYEVVSAGSTAEAVDALSRDHRPPSIILADYRLREGHTGTEAVRLIRELFHTAIPSVIITGDTAPERLREAEASGLSIVHKPIQPQALREILRSEMTQPPNRTVH
ncbi:MAG: PAS domain S-box protein [Magnetospirillum sp.]|nr:PAS domain S-box protein [Magnetospirillum sp.]